MTKARDIATSEVVTGEIGSTIQAYDADLDSIAALDKTDGNVIVGDGTNWVAESGATARASLGLGTAATTNSTDYATAAQGALADTALQPTGDGSGLTGIAGGFSNMQVFTSPGTWTNPGSVTKVKVTVVGGGGGTAGLSSPWVHSSSGGGGGGGSTIEVIPFPSATNVAVTVGGQSGTSSFGAYCSATGGAAGSVIHPGGGTGAGGGGGSGSGGNINFTGSRGGYGTANDIAVGGQGGSSLLGFGGGAGNQSPFVGGTSPGGNGAGYGGGGGGSAARTSNGNAQSGSPGVVIVEY